MINVYVLHIRIFVSLKFLVSNKKLHVFISLRIKKAVFLNLGFLFLFRNQS